MDFKALQDEASELLNFNSSQTDQDFTAAQIKKAINRAYAREFRKARQEGVREWFSGYREVVWPGDSLTFSVSGNLSGAQICKITDVTENLTGSGFHVVVYEGGDPPVGTPEWTSQGFSGPIFWKDRNTLQWGTSGPGEDRTLRFTIFPSPEELSSDGDVPQLIHPDHHELIFYSAAIDLRTRADEAAPQSWQMERQELRMDLYKDVSRGRPHTNVTSINYAY